MRGTKYFCITVGVLLLRGTHFPAPMPYALQGESVRNSGPLLFRWLRDEVLIIDTAKLAKEPGYKGEHPRNFVESRIIHQTIRDTERAVRGIWHAQFVMGLMWLAVGIRIPSRVTIAPATSPRERSEPQGRSPVRPDDDAARPWH
jgi:hypothetical protein